MANTYVLSEADYRRITTAVTWCEHQYRNTLGQPPGRGAGGGRKGQFAELIEILNGDYGSTADAEIVELKHDPATDTWDWEYTGKTITVWAPWILDEDNDLASGTRVYIEELKEGRWFVISAACST